MKPRSLPISPVHLLTGRYSSDRPTRLPMIANRCAINVTPAPLHGECPAGLPEPRTVRLLSDRITIRAHHSDWSQVIRFDRLKLCIYAGPRVTVLDDHHHTYSYCIALCMLPSSLPSVSRSIHTVSFDAVMWQRDAIVLPISAPRTE